MSRTHKLAFFLMGIVVGELIMLLVPSSPSWEKVPTKDDPTNISSHTVGPNIRLVFTKFKDSGFYLAEFNGARARLLSDDPMDIAKALYNDYENCKVIAITMGSDTPMECVIIDKEL